MIGSLVVGRLAAAGESIAPWAWVIVRGGRRETMDDLTEAQTTELKGALLALRGELQGLLDLSRDGTRPVG